MLSTCFSMLSQWEKPVCFRLEREQGLNAESLKGVGQADELRRARESCEAHMLFISVLRPVLKLLASGLWLWIMAHPHVAESTLTSFNSPGSHASLPALVPRCGQYARIRKTKFANKSVEFILTSDEMLVCLRCQRQTFSKCRRLRFVSPVLCNRFGGALFQKKEEEKNSVHHYVVIIITAFYF